MKLTKPMVRILECAAAGSFPRGTSSCGGANRRMRERMVAGGLIVNPYLPPNLTDAGRAALAEHEAKQRKQR